MSETMVMPSLQEPVLLEGRVDFTAEQQSIQAILDDTIAQAEATGENTPAVIPEPPNPDPVRQYIPRYDIDVPIDERVVLLEQFDGAVGLEEPLPPDPLNPADPVSPLATSESAGSEPYPDGVLRIPPDPAPVFPPPDTPLVG